MLMVRRTRHLISVTGGSPGKRWKETEGTEEVPSEICQVTQRLFLHRIIFGLVE
jgi:hypothetical protein